MGYVVRFGKKEVAGVQARYKLDPQLCMGRGSLGLPQYPEMSAMDALELKPGIRGWVPTGVDRRTPGYYQEKNRQQVNNTRPMR